MFYSMLFFGNWMVRNIVVIYGLIVHLQIWGQEAEVYPPHSIILSLLISYNKGVNTHWNPLKQIYKIDSYVYDV